MPESRRSPAVLCPGVPPQPHRGKTAAGSGLCECPLSDRAFYGCILSGSPFLPRFLRDSPSSDFAIQRKTAFRVRPKEVRRTSGSASRAASLSGRASPPDKAGSHIRKAPPQPVPRPGRHASDALHPSGRPSGGILPPERHPPLPEKGTPLRFTRPSRPAGKTERGKPSCRTKRSRIEKASPQPVPARAGIPPPDCIRQGTRPAAFCPRRDILPCRKRGRRSDSRARAAPAGKTDCGTPSCRRKSVPRQEPAPHRQ